LWPHWLAWEADAYEFAADLERPVLLSITGTLAGVPTESHEVVEIAFDEELDESLFVCEPQPDEAVEPAVPILERVSLAEAAASASFAVLQPTWLPEQDRLQREVMYHPAQHDHPDELTLHYRGGATFDSLWINERARREVALEQEGTWVDLISDLSREDLCRVAASLEPASR
jgi:hypothetical protein